MATEMERRAGRLRDYLAPGPQLTTAEKIGAEIGCGSVYVSRALVSAVRNPKNYEKYGFVLPYVGYGPTPHIYGIVYANMPKDYESFMDIYQRAVNDQLISRRLELQQFGRSLNAGRVNDLLIPESWWQELMDVWYRIHSGVN